MIHDAHARALRSFHGLAVGDAFGARCFTGRHAALDYPGDERVLVVPGTWRWTDDTAQAVAVVETLIECGHIDQDVLAARLADAFVREPWRGYGDGARKLLGQLARGQHWRDAASGLFDGQGSRGNGAAMRVAPLGAWFADDLDAVVEQARPSAQVTHTHIEGIAGAVAIALAAAVTWQMRDASPDEARATLFETVRDRTPDGVVRRQLEVAAALPQDATVDEALAVFGAPKPSTAEATVPFAIWSIARHRGAYGEPLWRTAAAGGDRDTTCAMVGGVVSLVRPDGGRGPRSVASLDGGVRTPTASRLTGRHRERSFVRQCHPSTRSVRSPCSGRSANVL